MMDRVTARTHYPGAATELEAIAAGRRAGWLAVGTAHPHYALGNVEAVRAVADDGRAWWILTADMIRRPEPNPLHLEEANR